MYFDLIRLSLLDRPPDLFRLLDAEKPPDTREEWLRRVFGAEIKFTHRRVAFHYVPDPDAAILFGGLIVGRIGRRVKARENEPPEQGMRETEREAWHALRIIIDPKHHEDGQKAAIERDPQVASGLALLNSLTAQANRVQVGPFLIEAKAISEVGSFWRFAENHHPITSVTFEVLAPNMFGIKDDFDQDRADLKKNENSDRTVVKLQSKDGLKVGTPLVRRLVDYVSKGTGKIDARAKDKHTFHSEDQVRSENFPDVEKNISWNDLSKLVVKRIFGV